MDEQRFERAPANRVRQYRSEIDRILAALGHPEAFVTDESRLRDFPLREDDDGPSLTELRIDLGLRRRRSRACRAPLLASAPRARALARAREDTLSVSIVEGLDTPARAGASSRRCEPQASSLANSAFTRFQASSAAAFW